MPANEAAARRGGPGAGRSDRIRRRTGVEPPRSGDQSSVHHAGERTRGVHSAGEILKHGAVSGFAGGYSYSPSISYLVLIDRDQCTQAKNQRAGRRMQSRPVSGTCD